MDHKDFSNLGEQLCQEVQKAIDSIDFKRIGGTITDTLNDAVSQAHNGLQRARAAARTSERTAPPPPTPMPEPRVRWVGRYAGVLCIVLGALGLAAFGAAAVLGLMGAALVAAPLPQTLTALILLCLPIGGCAALLGAGCSMRRRLCRLREYLSAAKVQGYCLVGRLAQRVHRTEAFVLRDLRGILRRGMLPDAHIDDEGGCLILDASVYRLYLESRQAMHAEQVPSEAPPQAPPSPTAVDDVLAEGRACMDALSEAERAIGKPSITDKLRRLETILHNIFRSLQNHPDQIDEVQKLIDYYLPTTVKLVQAYRDFDSVGIQGENLQTAKQEIEKTLENIGDAFERVLNDMYQDAAFDATADASVLQAMLAKDGLAASDFQKEDSIP